MEQSEFQAAVVQYQDMVYRIALHQFGVPQDAEDAVQEVFLRLYMEKKPFESGEHLRRWLIRVSINVCKDALKSPWRKRRVPMEAMRPKKRISKNLIMLAAVVALLTVLSAAAVAGDWFGLRGLLLPQDVATPIDPETGEQAVETVDMIGLSGYLDSPENKALAEWQAFLDGYDVMAAAKWLDAHPGAVDKKYALYGVYDREMAEKLDEIVEKYGLALHTDREIVLPDGWSTAAGDFLLEGNTAYSGYIYEDGTFAYDGDAGLPGYGLVDYQFRRSVRGCFNEVTLNIGDVSDYREWTYETACGETVTLALSQFKGLILIDLGDSFVTVNVLAGTETDPDDIFSSGAFAAENLENLADLFDFAALTPVKAPDLDTIAENSIPEGARPPETLEEDAIYAATGMEDSFAQSFYCGFYKAVEEDRREDVSNMIAWPRVLASEKEEILIMTAEEFLPYYDEVITQGLKDVMSENQYTEGRADLFYHDGSVGAAGGAVWFTLVEDGKAEIITLQNPEGVSVRYGGHIGRNVAGVYTDTQGTDEVYSSLELCDRGDGTYDAAISLYRLTTLDGMAAPRYDRGDGMLYFTSEDQLVEAVIGFSGDTSTVDTAAVTITYSELSNIQVGDTFRFPDGGV